MKKNCCLRFGGVFVVVMLFFILFSGDLSSVTSFSSLFSISGSGSVLFENKQYDTDSVASVFRFGDKSFVSKMTDFSCGQINKEFVAPQPSNTCWSALLNGEQFFYGQTKKYDGYSISYLPTAKYFSNVGFVSRYDWTNNYYFTIDNDAVVLKAKTNQIVFNQNSPASYLFEIDSKIGGLSAGVVITTNRGLFSRSIVEKKSFVLNKGVNVFSAELPTDLLGGVSVRVSPFVELFDYSQGFTSQDTGLCFLNKDKQKVCVQKRMLGVSQPLVYDFSVVQSDVNVNADIRTSCVITAQCPSGFTCTNNICTYKVVTNNFNITNLLNSIILYLQKITR